jgi:hypothetical protein
MKIDTQLKFDEAKQEHLKNLQAIRNFILGNEDNQPQVTYCPKMAEFDKLYHGVKEWLDTAYFDGDED